MKHLLLMLLIAASSFSVAQKRVVAIDVSQSMTHYGPWQEDVKQALGNVLFEGRNPDAKLWQSTGNLEVLKRYRANASVVVLRFGSVPSPEFPYFSTTDAESAQALAEQFPPVSSFRDQKTNKPLALGVAARLSAGDGSEGLAIVVSDFLADSDISKQHQEFINNAEAQYSQFIPLTLTWTRDPRVQLKFVQFQRNASDAPTDPQGGAISQAGTITLLPAEVSSGSQTRYLLRWKADSSFDRFNVKVEDALNRELLFSRSNVASREVAFPNPPARAMRWYVVGTTSSGQTSRSTTQNLPQIQRKSSIIPVLLLLALLVVAAVLVSRAQKLPTWMEKLLRRRSSEWS